MIEKERIKRIIILILIILGIAAIIFILIRLTYKEFTLNYDPNVASEERCLTYYKSCTCLGILTKELSYLPKYNCEGLNLCRKINKVECEN